MKFERGAPLFRHMIEEMTIPLFGWVPCKVAEERGSQHPVWKVSDSGRESGLTKSCIDVTEVPIRINSMDSDNR